MQMKRETVGTQVPDSSMELLVAGLGPFFAQPLAHETGLELLAVMKQATTAGLTECQSIPGEYSFTPWVGSRRGLKRVGVPSVPRR